jgi:hypothetical protein
VDWKEFHEESRRFWREMMLWQALICVELFVLIRLAASFKH